MSVVDPAGPQSAHIASLWWLMFVVSAIVFVVVLAFVFAAVIFGKRRAEARTPETSNGALVAAVSASVAVTVLTLFGLLAASVWTGRGVASLGASSAVTVAVTGHQWWWEVEYEDAVPSRRVRTANEIHIPIGRPVVLKVTSRDVIHSFWAPNLHGKRDLIPGYTTAIWLQADRVGVYRGQCAEFCGKQHAHMAFEVVAEPQAAFDAWLEAQRQPAKDPADDRVSRGRELFMTGRCAGCHRIGGTDAAGQIAPDLTHMASRRRVASAILPNSRDDLARWVRDPQHIKPGNQMPPNPLDGADLDALVAYLQSLQ